MSEPKRIGLVVAEASQPFLRCDDQGHDLPRLFEEALMSPLILEPGQVLALSVRPAAQPREPHA